MNEAAITHSELRRAMERGVITREQFEALTGAAATSAGEAPPESLEAPEDFNAITIAYYVGAFVVLFGFGWFLIDRWRALGPGGVLGVTLFYALLFLGTAYMLRKNGFAVAAAIATLLAVGMTPLVTWSLLKVTGTWPPEAGIGCEWQAPWAMHCRGKWIIVELATILASLIALRTVRYALLMKPIAVSLLVLTFHVSESLFGYTFQSTAAGWAVVAAASLILVMGYAVDVLNDTKQDYAFWLFLPGLVAAFIGMVMVWSYDKPLRHLLIVIAIVTMTVAVYMRRRTFLLFGAVWFVWYLGYVVFDVFRRVVALPILLATVGLVVILSAVWIQRTYPRLVSRVSRSTEGAPRIPGGFAILLAPAILALLMIPAVGPRDREMVLEQRHQQRMWAIRANRERKAAIARAVKDSLERARR